MTDAAASPQLELFESPLRARRQKAGISSQTPQPAHVVGAEHERHLAAQGLRKTNGAYYTPPDVVDRLLDLALDPILSARAHDGVDAVKSIRVIDPACGSGNFLVAAAARIRQQLVSLGVRPAEAQRHAFGECVFGIDLDQDAVSLCRASLVEGSQGEVNSATVDDRVRCADALTIGRRQSSLFSGSAGWMELQDRAGCSDGFDLVIGNPPFLSQLATKTARTTSTEAQIREQLGDSVARLADTATLFMLLGSKIAHPTRGNICLIQPMSFLSARGSSAARLQLLDRYDLTALWVCDEEVFDASVRVCAPLLGRYSGSPFVDLYVGRGFRSVGNSQILGDTWSSLLASAKGVPICRVSSQGVVADLATATADFRDQYYGLRGCVIDREHASDAEFPRLLTSGLIDPAEILWGNKAAKFDKSSFQYPRVQLSQLDLRMRQWATMRLGPKLVLATQTKVLEAAVDEEGNSLPSVPVISVRASDEADLWRLGALLTSPPVTAIAARRHLGAALSTEALKLSASDVLRLPLPENNQAWCRAGEYFREASRAREAEARRSALTDAAAAMCEAFGLVDDASILTWWRSRLPRLRQGKR